MSADETNPRRTPGETEPDQAPSEGIAPRPSEPEYELPRPGSLIGARVGRREAEAEAVIPAAPAQVWQILTDVERVAEWWPRAIGGFVVSGAEAGREHAVRLDWGRREGLVRQRVVEWEPPHRYAWKVIAEEADGKRLTPLSDTTVRVTITREGAQSRVKIYGIFLPAGPRGGLALRQMARLARTTYRRALKNLASRFLPGS